MLTIIKYSVAFRVLFAVLLWWFGRKGEKPARSYHMLFLCCCCCFFFACMRVCMCVCVSGQSQSVKNWQEVIASSKPLVKFVGTLCCRYITLYVCVMDLFDLPFTHFLVYNNQIRKPLFYVVNRCEYEMSIWFKQQWELMFEKCMNAKIETVILHQRTHTHTVTSKQILNSQHGCNNKCSRFCHCRK